MAGVQLFWTRHTSRRPSGNKLGIDGINQRTINYTFVQRYFNVTASWPDHFSENERPKKSSKLIFFSQKKIHYLAQCGN